MTDRIERAYYLRQEELAVLLSMKGMRQLFGFRMDVHGEMDQEALYRILFEMARQNMLSVCENRILIDECLSEILNDLVKAEYMWTLTAGEEYPECCIYAGQKLVFVSLQGQDGQMYRAEAVDRKEAYLKMQEYGFFVPGVLDKNQTCPGKQEEYLQMQKLSGKLYEQEKEDIIRREKVSCCLIQYSVIQKRKVRQLLIINGVLDDYLALSNGEQNQVYVYSDEKAEELFLELMGGGL